ncbi:MAG: hypothetical protein BMS9Abin03_015 [Thermodesulfobacteriota bacterium]|nr:MAG: hypothetical protein BMS9Abin03_015 [Thermodesulfobacteriota bacterium]
MTKKMMIGKPDKDEKGVDRLFNAANAACLIFSIIDIF